MCIDVYKRQTLDSEIAPDIQLQADEGRLREVVRILMDNACKYCEPKGKILVYLEQDGDWASQMCIRDSCTSKAALSQGP